MSPSRPRAWSWRSDGARVETYSGLVALVFFWPSVEIIRGDDSFRSLADWSVDALAMMTVFLLVVPSLALALGEKLASGSRTLLALYRGVVFAGAATLLWMHFVASYLNGWLWSVYLSARPIRYAVVLAGELGVLALLYWARRYVMPFFRVVCPLAVVAVTVLLHDTQVWAREWERRPDAAVASGPRLDKVAYLLVFDGVSLEALLAGDRVDATLFPNFARLSREWRWYRNAMTNGSMTVYAQPMMLSGRYLRYRGQQDYASIAADNLYSRLRPYLRVHSHMYDQRFCKHDLDDCEHGWFYGRSVCDRLTLVRAVAAAYVEAISPVQVTHFLRDETFLEHWWFHWAGPTPQHYAGSKDRYYADVYRAKFEKFLAAAGASERGHFYLHWSFLSHAPYVVDEHGQFHGSRFTRWVTGMTRAERAEVDRNYVRQLRYVDRWLGAFVAQLERSGVYDEAIVIVTSDHGMDFGAPAGPRRGAEPEDYRRIARVPFLVKAPGLSPGTDDRDVQSVDIVPTFLDLLDLPLSGGLTGRSVRAAAGERPRPFLSTNEQPFVLLDARWRPPTRGIDGGSEPDHRPTA